MSFGVVSLLTGVALFQQERVVRFFVLTFPRAAPVLYNSNFLPEINI
jgi:hypothetical protein